MRTVLAAVFLCGCATASPPHDPADPVGRPPPEQARSTGVIELVVVDAEPAVEPPRSVPDPDSPLGRRRITLDVREVPVREVLRLLAHEADANIVIDDAVTGTITLQLRNVTLDDAFFAVLGSQRLGYSQRGRIVLVQ